jgi:hypothetical protein
MRSTVSNLLFLLSIALGSGLYSQSYPRDYFQPPLDIPMILSGTFGELRTNHFHSGIDIKTQQRTGLPVKAAADGTIVRIKISPYGFGKALYLRHPNGFTTVYAHLKEFAPEIQDYVTENQYKNKTFDIELFPPAGTFDFKGGELIAFSGNSGGSGAPHLHFEVRDTRTEDIINPLLFGFPVSDSRNPDLYDLEVYEFEEEELVSTHSRDLIKVDGGSYALAGDDVVIVNHTPAFGIRTTDRLDGASNRNGIYSIELIVGGFSYYQFVMQRFAFAETRYINSHIDYGQKKCCRRVINKLYLEPNNRFSAYRNTASMSFPALEPDSTYDAFIRVQDAAGNESILEFKLRQETASPTMNSETQEQLPFAVFRYDQTNFFKKDNIEFSLPEGALYRNINFFYSRKEACDDCYSSVHVIASNEIPVHKYFTLKIKPDLSYEGDPEKLVIMSMEDGEPVDYEGGEWDGNYLKARTRQFGEFAIMADEKPPQAITGNFVDGGVLKSDSELRFIIKDRISGIADYEVYIDGEWQLFDYDAKNDLLRHDLGLSKLQAGEHAVELILRDEVGNESTHNYRFILR